MAVQRIQQAIDELDQARHVCGWQLTISLSEDGVDDRDNGTEAGRLGRISICVASFAVGVNVTHVECRQIAVILRHT